MANLNITGDNLPKDSGNRYIWGPFDPSGSAFKLPYAYPVSGDVGGLAVGHVTNSIADIMTATGSISSGIDLGGYSLYSVYIPPMGSGTELTFQASGSGWGWINVSTNARNATLSATGALATGYAFPFTSPWPFRYVRLSAANAQTATRTAVWNVIS